MHNDLNIILPVGIGGVDNLSGCLDLAAHVIQILHFQVLKQNGSKICCLLAPYADVL